VSLQIISRKFFKITKIYFRVYYDPFFAAAAAAGTADPTLRLQVNILNGENL
jgi:hypothetical protein